MVPVVDHTLLVAALTGQAFISSDIDRRIWLSSLIQESVEINDIWINNRSSFMLFDNPKMVKGSEPTDGGNLFLTEEEKSEYESHYPVLRKNGTCYP